MKKYNIANYIRYKKEIEEVLKRTRKPENGDYTILTDEEIKINFLPLVETISPSSKKKSVTLIAVVNNPPGLFLKSII